MNLTLKIGGAAGEGVMAAGAIFSKALVRAGLYISTTVEYPSLIRGGHNVYIIRASEDEITSLVKPVNLLVALNNETIQLHKDELSDDAGIIYDSNDQTVDISQINSKICLYPVPLLKIATQDGGKKLMMNNVALGSAWAVIDLPLEILTKVIADVFANKNQEIINDNQKAAKAGFDYVKNNPPAGKQIFPYRLKLGKAAEQLVLTGNEAIGLGAIKAGLGFASLYPMTPINGLLNFLAGHEKENGFIYFQPEDEIAGINSAIGASYAGLRSLVATSGGGFSLMEEGFGMAVMTETPLVVVMGTRPGPSSGLPTWTGQGDLKFLLGTSQGDFMRVILAPGDPLEAYELTQIAFNLADKYQMPVFLLVDKFLCESIGTIEKDALRHCEEGAKGDRRGNLKDCFADARNDDSFKNYKRYKINSNGISPRAIPGQVYFVTNSYEHDDLGYSTEDASVIKAMVEKRARKYESLAKEVPEPVVYGEHDAEVTLVGWGSTKGTAREAILGIKELGIRANCLHLNWINPFPKEAVTRILSGAKKIIDVEGNPSGQMAGWIREQTGIEIKDKILKYDGRQFYPEDIIEGVKKYV